MRPVLVLSDYFVKLVILASRTIQKLAVIYWFVSLQVHSLFYAKKKRLLICKQPSSVEFPCTQTVASSFMPQKASLVCMRS